MTLSLPILINLHNFQWIYLYFNQIRVPLLWPPHFLMLYCEQKHETLYIYLISPMKWINWFCSLFLMSNFCLYFSDCYFSEILNSIIINKYFIVNKDFILFFITTWISIIILKQILSKFTVNFS